MWFLYAIQDGQDKSKTFLRPGRVYTMGRKGADIIPLVPDKSISREHARLQVEPITGDTWNDIEYVPPVLVYDMKSKFGTFVNSNRVELSKTGTPLQSKDIIRIGTKNAYYRLEYEPLVLCRQSMPQADKQRVYGIAQEIGAKITQSIRSSYTHLLMKTLQMSFKVARCLADVKPIVSLEWLEALVALPDSDYELPATTSYLPPIDISCQGPLGIPDFAPNQRRASLFAGKQFVFFDQDQHRILSPTIAACKGTSRLLDINNTDPFEEHLDDADTIVINHGSLLSTNSGKNIIVALDSVNKRIVDNMEVCWAIAYYSVDLYCNTRVNSSAIVSLSNSNSISSNGVSTSSRSDIPGDNSKKDTLSSPLSSSSSPHGKQQVTMGATKTDKREPVDTGLDDLFDDIIGDEPPLPPPKAKLNAPAGCSHSEEIAPASEIGKCDRVEESIVQLPENHTTIISRSPMASKHQPAFASDQLQQSPSSSTLFSNVKRRHPDDENQPVDKGKRRLQAVLHLHDMHYSEDNDNNTQTNNNSHLVDNGSNTTHIKRNTRKKKADSVNDGSTSQIEARTPFKLPELENENIDIEAGRTYTKVNHIKMVTNPHPPEDWGQQRRQPLQRSSQINFKRFKKATHPIAADPLSYVNMSIASQGRLQNQPRAQNTEEDFSDIRIRSVAGNKFRF